MGFYRLSDKLFNKGRHAGMPLQVRCIIRFNVGANLCVRPYCELIFLIYKKKAQPLLSSNKAWAFSMN